MRAYADDYAGWIEDTAQAIEHRDYASIDHLALADEVRDLGISEHRQLQSHLRVLLTHLLKDRYQPERRTAGWEATIKVQRKHVQKSLIRSPSLKASLAEMVEDAYEEAHKPPDVAPDQRGTSADLAA